MLDPVNFSMAGCPVLWDHAERHPRAAHLRGGDVFARWVARDGTFTIVVADVSSKGSLGETHAQAIRTLFSRSVARDVGPAGTLHSLNAIPFNRRSDNGAFTFATAFVAAFAPGEETVTYASAGHDVALVLRGHEHVHLAPTGPVLGVFDDGHYDERSVRFARGDVLAIATDGVTEVRSAVQPTRQLGTTGLVRAFASTAGEHRGSPAAAAMRVTDAFCGGEYRDEATLLALRRIDHSYSHFI